MTERWLPIPGYANYRVSDLGTVIGARGRPLKPAISRKGYVVVSLSRDGVTVNRRIHRLVLLAFVGPSEAMVCHINGDPGDNNLTNLKYGSAQENADHRRLHGKTAIGERGGHARLTDEQVREAIALKAAATKPQWGLAAFARQRGLHPSTVTKAASGTTWKHLKLGGGNGT